MPFIGTAAGIKNEKSPDALDRGFFISASRRLPCGARRGSMASKMTVRVSQGGETMTTSESEETANRVVGQPPRAIVRYTVGVSAAVLVLFYVVLWAESTVRSVAEPQDSGTSADGIHWLLIVGITSLSGALGGCLYSLRGLIEHSSKNDFSTDYNYWYYLLPLAGGICGIIVLFLLLGGALTLTVTGPQGQTLRSITGVVLAPYIALALLAGFASRVFMLKMKDLADSLFALSTKDKSAKPDKSA